MAALRYLCAVIRLSNTMKERKGKSTKPSSAGRPASARKSSSEGKPASKRSSSSEDRQGSGRGKASEGRSGTGRKTAAEDRPSSGRRSFSESRPNSDRRSSSENKSTPGRRSFADGKPASERKGTSEDRPRPGRSASSERKPAAGKRGSFDGKPTGGRRGGTDKPRPGRPSTVKGRTGAARQSNGHDSEGPRSYKPVSETHVDPRHTRGAVKAIKKSEPEPPKRTARANEYRDKERSRDENYSRSGNFKKEETVFNPKKDDGTIRLNKFLSNAGIASRREADRLIELGLVTVNGKPVTELGHKVDPSKDLVKYDDVALRPERYRYVLLNKPKDYITTMDDPEGRKTVMFLIKDACKERIYPVGRLDRNTTGLLLFTNDGELAKRLTHPKNGYAKLYHVETIEKVNPKHLDELRTGITLEDGLIVADEVSYVNDDPRQVGIRIHSGKNRIVRRIFEHYNYTIKKLDRVMFAGLTKKDLPRGRFRHLSEQEMNFLKMIR